MVENGGEIVEKQI